MSTFQQVFLTSGALFGFLGVAAGAFGAHLLKSKLSPYAFEVFEVGVRYQMYHALVLVALAILMALFPSSWFHAAGWLFICGVVIFSGSLYILALSGVKAWGAITPIGGLLLLLGWLSLILGGLIRH